MKISARNLSFSHTDKPLFESLTADFDGGGTGRPLVILGPSGCGKTTLLKLLGGLLKPLAGEIVFSDATNGKQEIPKTAFMFQEPRLIPWVNVLENVNVPLLKIFGKEEALARARRFVSLVSLDGLEAAYPRQLSGGQAQRVSMARAFAWPSAALFMDEPFQSLDIPLRISLMETCLSLLERDNLSKENSSHDSRLLIAVTHDPREALYMGGRIIILGRAGEGIVFDRVIKDLPKERAYGSPEQANLEREIIKVLEAHS